MHRTRRFLQGTLGAAALLAALPSLAPAQTPEQLQAGVRHSPSGWERTMVHPDTQPATLAAVDHVRAGVRYATVPARSDYRASVAEQPNPAARPSRRGRHALIGAGIGIVSGAVVGYLIGHKEDRTCTEGPYCGGLGRINALGYAALGGAAGAIVGVLVP